MLVVYDQDWMAECRRLERGAAEPFSLDEPSRAIARVAAMIANDGSAQMFRWAIDDALDAGVTPDEVVGVMLAIAPLVGNARIANSAPKVALALDYDLDEALEIADP